MAYISERGGYAGTSTPVGQKKKSIAGSPGGWFNIQDFMDANKGSSITQSRIQGRGLEQLGGAVSQLSQQQADLQAIPEAEKFSSERLTGIREGGIDQNEISSLSNYLGQTPGSSQAGIQSYELDPASQMQSISSPYGGLQSGDLNSIMNWYGELERPSASYTPGMQKMDEMLLRGNTDFVQQFPEQLQSQFQTNVTDKLAQSRSDIAGRQKEAKDAYTAERGHWTGGIDQFLGSEENKINQEYQKQADQLYQVDTTRPQDVMSAEDWAKISEFMPSQLGSKELSPKPTDYETYGVGAIDPYTLMNRGVVLDPTFETAAQSALTPEQMSSYNTLSGLIGEDFTGEHSTISGGVQFDPGAWSYNADAIGGLYDQKVADYQSGASQKQIADIMLELDKLSGMESTGLTPGMDAAAANEMGMNISYYDVPEAMTTKYGQVDAHDQAGQRVYAPTHEKEKDFDLYDATTNYMGDLYGYSEASMEGLDSLASSATAPVTEFIDNAGDSVGGTVGEQIDYSTNYMHPSFGSYSSYSDNLNNQIGNVATPVVNTVTGAIDYTKEKVEDLLDSLGF